MKNPITKRGMFATPESMEFFQEYLSRFNGNEGLVAQVGAWMAWNLASEFVDEAIKESTINYNQGIKDAMQVLVDWQDRDLEEIHQLMEELISPPEDETNKA
jgi:hypothetical protein